jgi:glycosyltransferase involved in cell wall biosynthesis
MRVAILGSVALPVPPPKQGGTEWIAYYQAQGLAQKGHDVTLFAAKGSKKGKYNLVEVGGGDTVAGSFKSTDADYSIESSRKLRKENVYLSEVMEKLIEMKDDYDIILNNMRGEAVFLPLAKMLGKPFVNVMHLPIFPELAGVFQKYNTHVITISNAQRKGFDSLNYLATVYNGIDPDLFSFNPNPSDYLLMLGTIGRHKNQKGAIEVSKRLNMDLILAGKVRDQDYFEEIKKDIDGVKIQWVGEIGLEERVKLYQNAKAFIFPILWEEPFGLVMIEAMSCGTPVIAFGNGAIPEVVVNGMNGFVIEDNSIDKLADAAMAVDKIKREDCRQHMVQNFSVKKMVEDYEKVLLSLNV